MTTPAAATPATAVGLTAIYAAAIASLRQHLSGMVSALFGQGGYRDDAAAAYVEAMAPVADAAQQTVANLTAAYLAHQVGTLSDGVTAPAAVPLGLVTGVALRNGADPAEVLRRPYEQVWTALSQGKTLDQAVAVGEQRALSIAMTDLQLAKTRTAQVVLTQDHRVTGYRRALNGTHSCAMCIVASTRRYRKAELMPIHPGCDCNVEPITGPDQGPVLDDMPLAQVHEAIRRDLGARYVSADAKTGVDYRKVIVTHQHGEIGPVLGVRGQHFTGPRQISGG